MCVLRHSCSSQCSSQCSGQYCYNHLQVDPRSIKLATALQQLPVEQAAIEVPAPLAGGIGVSALLILDPLSRTAQRVAPLLEFLRENLGIAVKVGRPLMMQVCVMKS